MQIEKNSGGDLLELTLHGRLDNDSSIYFREEIESSVRDGWHRIVVDLSGVDYLSSSGIAALVDARQRMERLAGLFGVHDASPEVEKVLRLTGLWNRLRIDPQTARAGATASSAAVRLAHECGLDLEIYSLCEAPALRCRVFGEPESLFDSHDSQRKLSSVLFGRQTLGLGLGVLAHQPDASPADLYKAKHGEILAVGGAAAQSAHEGRGLPDYLVAAGDFVPSAQIRYGFQCEGELPVLIRFQPAEAESPVGLSTIVSCGAQPDEVATRGTGDSGRLCGPCGRPTATVARQGSVGCRRSLQPAGDSRLALVQHRVGPAEQPGLDCGDCRRRVARRLVADRRPVAADGRKRRVGRAFSCRRLSASTAEEANVAFAIVGDGAV